MEFHPIVSGPPGCHHAGDGDAWMMAVASAHEGGALWRAQEALRKAVAASAAPGRCVVTPPRTAQGRQRSPGTGLAPLPDGSGLAPQQTGAAFARFNDQRTRTAGEGEAG
jgi:hypothetical protein